MSSAPVQRFTSPFQRLYRKLTRRGKTTTRTTYTTASPILSSPQQPAPKVRSEQSSHHIPPYFARALAADQIFLALPLPSQQGIIPEPIFVVDCKAPFPSIDSLLAIFEPAEQEAPLFIAADSPTGAASPLLEQVAAEIPYEPTTIAIEEQKPTVSVVSEQKEGVEEAHLEENDFEALFDSSDENSWDTTSITTITTATTPSTPPSPRFNPSFERSSTFAETESSTLFTSNLESKLSPSPSSQEICTWISLIAKPLRFNPSFERSPSPFVCAELPLSLAPSPFIDMDAALPLYTSDSPSEQTSIRAEPTDSCLFSTFTHSQRYPSFISWDAPSPRRRRLVQRAWDYSRGRIGGQYASGVGGGGAAWWVLRMESEEDGEGARNLASLIDYQLS
jgi:hypothetical protein